MQKIYLMPEPVVSYARPFIEHIYTRYGLKAVCLYSDAKLAHYQRHLLPPNPSRFIEAQYSATGARMGDVADELRRKYEIVGIVPSGEPSVAPAARWAELLGIRWNDPAVLRRFRDKYAFKAHLRQNHPEIALNTSRIVRAASELLDARASLPARFVLKPNAGMGNRGVGFFTRESSAAEIESFFAAGHGQTYVLEDRLVGREHCVNGQIDEKGNVIVTQVMEDERTTANDVPNVYAVTRHLPRSAPAYAPLVRYAESVMRASGLVRCPFHLEAMYDEALGPRLIEVGARFAGSDLAAACDDVHGGRFDSIAVAAHYYLHDTKLSNLGLDWDYYDRVHFAVVAGIALERGVVYNVRGTREVERLAEFRRWDKQVKPGDVVEKTIDLFTMPYSVHLRGLGSPEQLEGAIETARRSVRWNVEPTAKEKVSVDVKRFAHRVQNRVSWALRAVDAPGVVRIERAGWRDLPALVRLDQRAFGPRDANGVRTLAKLVRSADHIALKAVVSGRVIGFASLSAYPNADSALFKAIAVDPEWQGQNVGRKLALECEALRGKPGPSVRVQARAHDAGFFEKLGYTRVGLAPAFYRDGEDAYVMEKRIPTKAPTNPALLTSPGYYGTLAAIRCLGRSGVEVTAADSNPRAAGLASRFVARKVQCPPSNESEAFLAWLLRFGDENPNHLLYPTSDDTAWLFSAYRDELSKRFSMFQPPLDVIYTLLNKKLLLAAARGAGFDVPTTFCPSSREELLAITRNPSEPWLIKPQTQILFQSRVKGRLVGPGDDLVREYEAFMGINHYAPMLRARDPNVQWPIIQEYRPEAMEKIYSIAGFVDQRAGIFVARASRKIFQHPRRIGVGLCFDAAPVDAKLADRIRRLCGQIGYYGAFEVEFIPTPDGRYLLTDFNPRYYGQMGFEIARGLPIPLLVQSAGMGDLRQLRALVAEASNSASSGAQMYCHRFLLDTTLAAQRFSGRLSREDVARWQAWYTDDDARCVDAVADRVDDKPAARDRAALMLGWARHPRAFVRTMFLNA